jgi:hypothetical protein
MIIFVHIAKTAGTSLFDWFHDVTGRRVGWYSPQNTPDVFFRNPENRANRLVYGGHFNYCQVKPFLTPEDTVFSVLREPVARVASYYNHVVVRDKNHPLHQEVVGKSIIEAAKTSPRFLNEIRNQQCFYLSGHGFFSEARSVVDEYRPRVFTINQLSQLTTQVANILGSRDVPELHCNNTAETEYFSQISDSDKDYVREINQEDSKLYNWVLQNEGLSDT